MLTNNPLAATKSARTDTTCTAHAAALRQGWFVDLFRPERVLGCSLYRQNVDRVVPDREHCPVAGTRSESDELLADLIREIIVLGRQTIALREMRQCLDLVVNRIGPPYRLFDGMMIGPPIRVAIDVSMRLRKNDDAKRH